MGRKKMGWAKGFDFSLKKSKGKEDYSLFRPSERAQTSSFLEGIGWKKDTGLKYLFAIRG